MWRNQRILFTAFDAYPGHKGAQAHIRNNLRATAGLGARPLLICLGDGVSFTEPDSTALIHSFSCSERNLLRRSEAFGRFVLRMADAMLPEPPALIHFRDIWSGYPLLAHPLSSHCPVIFEVNGLPSVELPCRYPALARNAPLLARLRRMEEQCLQRADRIITISARTARYLERRGGAPARISVIPNAAEAAGMIQSAAGKAVTLNRPTSPFKTILYAGTLAPWQGVDTLLEAMSHLRHRTDCRLIVAVSNTKGIKQFRKQLGQRELGGRTELLEKTPHDRMPALYAGSYLSVTPLTRGARNERQGCCPLKIVESMANALPVVASDLPVARELITHGEDGILVVPESGRALARALEMLLDNETLRDNLALRARRKAEREFGVGLYAERLVAVYNDVMGGGHGK